MAPGGAVPGYDVVLYQYCWHRPGITWGSASLAGPHCRTVGYREARRQTPSDRAVRQSLKVETPAQEIADRPEEDRRVLYPREVAAVPHHDEL